MQPLQEIAASSLPRDISLIYAAGGHWQAKRLAGVYSLMLETKNAAFILEEKWSAKYGGNQNLIQILVSKTLHSANIRISRYWLFFDDVAYYSPGALK